MPVPAIFDRLRIPVIGAPLFIVSNPDLVIAQCKAGIVGSFPSLNARPASQLDEGVGGRLLCDEMISAISFAFLYTV